MVGGAEQHLLTPVNTVPRARRVLILLSHYAKDAPMRDLVEHDEFDCYPAICDVTRKDG